MATNPYINKVVFGQNTLIDISDSNVVESDVAAGKKFYKADGSPAIGTSSGGAGSAIIVDTLDEGGGTIRTITTTDEYHVQASKTVTPTSQVQVITPDEGYDALASVTVNAGGGGASEFAITLTLSNNGEWLPNKTFAEISAAYARGDIFTISATNSGEPCPTTVNTQGMGEATPTLFYCIEWFDYNEIVASGNWFYVDWYIVDSSGVSLDDRQSSTYPPELTTKTITANGTYNASSDSADGYSSVTVNVPSGGGGGSADDVIFIDYDGTILHSYSASEFQALSAMPSNPTHSGLTSQGWNWSLADAKAQVTAMGSCIIGQMYVTDDGKTRVYIHLGDERKSPILGIAPNGTVDVDWGDGTAHDTLTGTSLTTVKWTSTHNYANGGDYVIKLTVTNGTAAIYGTSSSNRYSQLVHFSSGADSRNYYYNSSIKRVEIGNSVSLGEYAFYYCYSLKNVTIPNNIPGIESYAFAYSTSLCGCITIPSGFSRIKSYSFYGCQALPFVSLPKSVTYFEDQSFRNCYALKKISIPSGVINLGSYAFQNCNELNKVAIPNNVVNIPTYAFAGCYSLEEVSIPNTVTNIATHAFSTCYSLNSLVLPSGLETIGNNAFASCRNITSITIPSSVTSLGTYAFQNCYSLKTIEIPNKITSLGSNLFSGCYSLASISLPNTITSIGQSSIQNCYALEEITIPSGVTEILGSALQSCYALSELTIPNTVTNIGATAFGQCYGIGEYHLLRTTPPTLANSSAFQSMPADCKIYVPYSADHSILEAYQTATNWSTLSQYIVEEPAP